MSVAQTKFNNLNVVLFGGFKAPMWWSAIRRSRDYIAKAILR